MRFARFFTFSYNFLPVSIQSFTRFTFLLLLLLSMMNSFPFEMKNLQNEIPITTASMIYFVTFLKRDFSAQEIVVSRLLHGIVCYITRRVEKAQTLSVVKSGLNKVCASWESSCIKSESEANDR